MRFEGTRWARRLLLAAAVAIAFATPVAAWRAGPFIIFFAYDRANLEPQAAAILDNLADGLRNFPEARIVVQGHADRSGTPRRNLHLSCRRARQAFGYLVTRGVAPERMTVRAYGEARPLVDTEDGMREPQNRRVQFHFGTAAEIAEAGEGGHRC